MERKKYIINIDFNTRSVIHLNPKLFDVDSRCIVKEKIKAHGGWEEYSEEEVILFLEQKRKLFFKGRSASELTVCKLCSKLEEYTLPFIEKIKEIEKLILEPPREITINYKKIEKFLDDISIDVHNIVNNLDFFLSPKDKELKESFKKNLYVFDNSISKGKKTLRAEQHLEALEDHGFETPELERKLKLYYQAREYEFPRQKDETTHAEKPKWHQKLWNKVKKHLDIIDVILGSLSSAVPGLSAATEFKETVEHTVNYSYA